MGKLNMVSVLNLETRRIDADRVEARITTGAIPLAGVKNATGETYAKEFAFALKAIGTYRKLDIIIDATGGHTHSAVGMRSALESIDAEKRVLIYNNCSSAAILCAFWPGVPVTMVMGSRIKVHRAQRTTYNTTGLMRIISSVGGGMLDTLMIATLKEKSKRRKRICKQWLDEAKTFNAVEALEVGLVDEIIRRRGDWR